MTLRNLFLCGAALAVTAIASTPSFAQSNDDLGVEILQLLVDEGVIPFDRAQGLLDAARRNAALRAETQAAAQAENVINVPYVPETVRTEIAESIKSDVIQTAQAEGWVAPNTLPEWTQRVSISGDLRVRGQWENYADDNFPFFPDANAINQQGGVLDTEGFPLLNSTFDRNRVLYRARLNVEAQVTDKVKVGIRFASGDAPGAISTNSIFGNYFDRNTLWVDQAFVDVEPIEGVHFLAGRMPNPFYSTTLVWDEDINPEGVALTGAYSFSERANVFATAGVFPLQERELFDDSYLYAGQLGGEVEFASSFFAKAGLSYYHYENVQSLKNADDGSRLTDWSAPEFLSKGNSIFNMRTDGLTTLAGLASEFEVGALTAEIGYTAGAHEFKLIGEVAKNFAMDESDIAQLRGEAGVKPGDLGWTVRAFAGHSQVEEAGQWRLMAGYRHVETDAVLDIFTDSDFALGGTDVEGYELEAIYGVYDNTNLALRWLSSDSIERAPYSLDILHFDLNVSF
ncbi:putative porin [Woodsholea maritima]|uniref:putative porin n=1 Tax=Woodsholea maritima TaxID=240237 RepID=UPI000379AD03|nr:putative porin [Woodsholea maritima]